MSWQSHYPVSEVGTEPIDPVTDRFVADVDPAFME